MRISGDVIVCVGHRHVFPGLFSEKNGLRGFWNEDITVTDQLERRERSKKDCVVRPKHNARSQVCFYL